jgi:hypothetical protein
MRKTRPASALMRAAFVLLLLPASASTQSASPCSTGTPHRGCRACGSAKSIRAQQENVLKNRDASAEKVQALTVNEIRDPASNGKFNEDMAVELTGYVAEVAGGGIRETCNCERDDLRDVQISIVASPGEVGNRSKYVIVEISPRWEEKLGLGGARYPEMLARVKSQIQGKWVALRGWLLYDYVHLSESESTAPGNPSNWRATAWEVHPVTSLTVLTMPPSK